MKNRPRFAEKVALLSGLALLGFLFLDWFGQGDRPALSGWEALGWLALGLCIVAALSGIATFAAFVVYESPVLPLAVSIVALVAGGLAVIALLVQVVFQPGPDETTTVMSGWWLGLLAAAGVARGAFLSMRDEYLPGVPVPEVEVRPAPVT